MAVVLIEFGAAAPQLRGLGRCSKLDEAKSPCQQWIVDDKDGFGVPFAESSDMSTFEGGNALSPGFSGSDDEIGHGCGVSRLVADNGCGLDDASVGTLLCSSVFDTAFWSAITLAMEVTAVIEADSVDASAFQTEAMDNTEAEFVDASAFQNVAASASDTEAMADTAADLTDTSVSDTEATAPKTPRCRLLRKQISSMSTPSKAAECRRSARLSIKRDSEEVPPTTIKWRPSNAKGTKCDGAKRRKFVANSLCMDGQFRLLECIRTLEVSSS